MMDKGLEKEIINVLLVEDDEDDYVLASSLLDEIQAETFVTTWSRSYEDALEKLAGDGFDVCLVDYRLGAHTGIELLQKIHETGFKGPVILLTGQGDQEIDFEAMKAGAADYLVKGELTAASLERSIRYSIQQKQMEEERVKRIRDQEARTQAEEANKAKDEFLAMVSHELRTPLNAMLGWVSILRTSDGSEDVYERAIDAIERSAKVQHRLVNDLLDISRIANGTLWIDRQGVSLASVVESAVDEVFPTAQEKKIELEVKLETIERVVVGDPNRLQQVVTNLVQNAVKFTPEGGRVTVALEHSADSARLSVSDTGQGISKEFLPYVFDRYRQARDAKDRKLGVGLGLAIARHIVELHGGTITAESQGEGQGATFSVSLPLAEVAAAA